MSTSTSTSPTGLTIEAMTESLTGFEEIAITKAFGVDIAELPGTQPVRALVFAYRRRQGDTDKDAYDAAMSLSMRAAMDHFDRPESEDDQEGKGDTPPA